VIVVVCREAVLADLLEDGDKRWDEVLELFGLAGLAHLLNHTEAGPHDRGILVAKHAAELFREGGCTDLLWG